MIFRKWFGNAKSSDQWILNVSPRWILIFNQILNQNLSNPSSQQQQRWKVPDVHMFEIFHTSIFWIFEQDLGTCPCQIRRSVSGSMLESKSRSDSCFDLSVCLVLFTGVRQDSLHSSLRTNWLSPRFYLFLSFIPSCLYWKNVSHYLWIKIF